MFVSRLYAQLAVLGVVLLVCSANVASADTFNIVYDDLANRQIGTVIGTRTFSYDGPITTGSFLLSSLTGLTFTATFPGLGVSFSTTDLLTGVPGFPAPGTGISVFNTADGQFGLVFTGGGFVGSLNALNFRGDFLTHEQTSYVSIRLGCCGGKGTINEYQLFAEGLSVAPHIFGDYRALAAAPEPTSFMLLESGLAMLLTLIGSGRWIAGHSRPNRAHD